MELPVNRWNRRPWFGHGHSSQSSLRIQRTDNCLPWGTSTICYPPASQTHFYSSTYHRRFSSPSCVLLSRLELPKECAFNAIQVSYRYWSHQYWTARQGLGWLESLGQSSQVESSYACLTITIFSVYCSGKKLEKYFNRLSAPCQEGPRLIHISCSQHPAPWLICSSWLICS